MTRDESKQIGILLGETQGINNRLDRFNGQIKDLTNVIRTLPCQAHECRIDTLEKHNDDETVELRINKSIRGNVKAQLIGAWTTAGTAIGIAVYQCFG